MGFEQYVDAAPSAMRSDDFSDFTAGIACGITAAAENAYRNSLSTSATFTGSLVAGVLLAQATKANGLVGYLGNATASALGVLTLSESLRGIPFPNEFDSKTLGVRLGHTAFNGTVAACGGLLGARLGSEAMLGTARIREWPRVVQDIDHPFGEGLVYRSTTRGAELRFPHGETYRWRGTRPYFETETTPTGVEITWFGDGSELKLHPGRKFEFSGKDVGNKLVLRSDLQKGMHIAEYDRYVLGKPHSRRWERMYSFGDGTILVQYPHDTYEITHARGWGFEASRKLASPEDPARLLFGLRPPKPARILELQDGSVRAVFDRNTELVINPNGRIHLKATSWKTFD